MSHLLHWPGISSRHISVTLHKEELTGVGVRDRNGTCGRGKVDPEFRLGRGRLRSPTNRKYRGCKVCRLSTTEYYKKGQIPLT